VSVFDISGYGAGRAPGLVRSPALRSTAGHQPELAEVELPLPTPLSLPICGDVDPGLKPSAIRSGLVAAADQD